MKGTKMSDLNTTISKLNDTDVAALLEEGRRAPDHSPEELGEDLRHLLRLPVGRALNQLPRALQATLKRQAAALGICEPAGEAALCTFAELLDKDPPLHEWLVFAKDFGKAIAHHKAAAWPAAVGEVLYYAAYAAALTRAQPLPGTLGTDDLKRAFQTLRSRAWIGPQLSRLFVSAEAAEPKGKRTPGGKQFRDTAD